jgi:hypothetical protein
MTESEIKKLAEGYHLWDALKIMVGLGYAYHEALIAMITALDLDQADIEEMVVTYMKEN